MSHRAQYWVVQDHVAGLLTRYAQLENGAILRSLPIDAQSIHPVRLKLVGLRWIKTDAIPDNAAFIGESDPPLTVDD